MSRDLIINKRAGWPYLRFSIFPRFDDGSSWKRVEESLTYFHHNCQSRGLLHDDGPVLLLLLPLLLYLIKCVF